MKIHWNENPLKTEVEVNDNDRERILLYVQNEHYSEILCGLDLWLKGKIRHGELISIEKIRNAVSGWGEICNMTTESEYVTEYVDQLKYAHVGDCTCLPTSCMKCMAEEALGIDTIAGLGKHSAHKIQNAFGGFGDLPSRSIDEAIEILQTKPEYKKPDNWPDSVGYEKHISRWEAERKSALDWLVNYKKKHGF